MANVLSADKQKTIIASLCEGSSIRSIERITGVHRDTIIRLGVRVGQGCTELMDATMRDLPCTRLEMDEYAWSHTTDDPENPRKHVTVLHCHPIQSARDAVRAVIIQEFRANAESEA